MNGIARSRKARWVSMLVLAATCGCNLFVPIIFLGEHKRKVPAEFDKLQGKRVLVFVWAPPETLYDYPHIRMELGAYIGDKISGGVAEAEIVPAERVEDFLQRHLEATVDPVDVGRHFEADYVVYVELLEFQMRDPNAPDLLRASVSGAVTVYNLRADPDETDRFVLDTVQLSYPENGPVLMSSHNSVVVRQQTYEQFSERVARKFYEHKVDL